MQCKYVSSSKPFMTNYLYEHAEWIAPGYFMGVEF